VVEWKTERLPSAYRTSAIVTAPVLVDPQGQKVFVYDKRHLVPSENMKPFPLIHPRRAERLERVGGFHKEVGAVGTFPNNTNSRFHLLYEAIYPEKSVSLPLRAQISSSHFE